jgi:hypothetical protein
MVSFSLPYFLPYSDIAYMFNCLFVSMLFRVSFLVRTLADGNCSRATSVKTVGVCGSISWPLLSPIESVGGIFLEQADRELQTAISNVRQPIRQFAISRTIPCHWVWMGYSDARLNPC